MSATLRLDHISIYVRDLDASAQFYQKVLGLAEIANLAGHAHVRWFGFDGAHAIHLISGPAGAPPARPIASHFALACPDFEARVAALTQANVSFGDYYGRKGHIGVRADGMRSVYLQDPDDYWIELLDAPDHRP